MSTTISLFDVARIEIRASGACSPVDQNQVYWWQTLKMLNSRGETIGEVTLHLADATVALPLGEQPPYFGIDPRRLPVVMEGEVAPF